MNRATRASGGTAALPAGDGAGVAQILRDIPYGDGRMNVGDLHLPAGDRSKAPVFLAIHGGGWRHGNRDSWVGVAQFLQEECGAAVFNIEYRLSEEPDGKWPASADDCTAAAKFLLSRGFQERHGLSARRIYVIGGSAGGHLALWAGLSIPAENVEGIIAISCIGDPRPDYAMHRERYDALLGHAPSEADLESLMPPIPAKGYPAPRILLTHAISDSIVPLASAQGFIDRCREAGHPCEMFLFCADSEPNTGGHGIYRPGTEPRRPLHLLETRIKRFIEKRPAYNVTPVGVGFEMLDRELFDPGRCYDKLAETGVSMARCQTGWCRCEQEKGVHDFAWLDSVVDNLSARGIEPWFSVSYGNALYMSGCHTKAAVGCVPLCYGDECRDAWCAYVRAMARHFRGRVRCWEIWNEPDLEHFWQPRKPDAEDYARLVKLTGGIIREEAPGARIGGVSCTVLNEWIIKFAGIGAKDIDFFCAHCYGTHPEKAKWIARDPSGREWNFVEQVDALRGHFAAGGNPNVEIWNGEAGIPSWFPRNHWLLRDNPEGIGSEEIQAKWMLRRFLTDRKAGMGLSSFFCMVDLGAKPYSVGDATQKKPARQGLLTMGYERKMSHRVMGVYNRILGGASFDPKASISITADGAAIEQAGFALPDGRKAVAYWLPNDAMSDEPDRAARIGAAGGTEYDMVSLMTGEQVASGIAEGATVPLSNEARLLVARSQ